MHRFSSRIPRLMIAAAGAVAIMLVVPIVVRSMVQPHLFTTSDGIRPAQAALILGASVVAGQPSAILAQRADTAIALYRAGIVKKLLVTGDDGERSYDEVSPVLTYLLEKGIPGRDIFLDHAGFDTYSSMYRARHIFGARSLVIVTQDFHLPRAVFLARAMGIDADGLVAGDGGTAWDYLREIPATIKAVADLAFHRQSKYLGAPMPLVGKGNAIR